MNQYTQVEHPNDYEGASTIWSCNDCGAYADAPKNVKHHKTCTPGESKYWEEFYSKEENNV